MFTVVALLAYATQRAQVARNNLKTVIKEAPTEETKIAEHECYINLVETFQRNYGHLKLREPNS